LEGVVAKYYSHTKYKINRRFFKGYKKAPTALAIGALFFVVGVWTIGLSERVITQQGCANIVSLDRKTY
jgi:hypothetical protein